MHSRSADWVFGLARLISSPMTMFANTGPRLNSNRRLGLVEDRDAGHVARQQVGRELDAADRGVDRACERLGEHRLAHAGHVFDEEVPLGEQHRERRGHRVALAADHRLDVLHDRERRARPPRRCPVRRRAPHVLRRWCSPLRSLRHRPLEIARPPRRARTGPRRRRVRPPGARANSTRARSPGRAGGRPSRPPRDVGSRSPSASRRPRRAASGCPSRARSRRRRCSSRPGAPCSTTPRRCAPGCRRRRSTARSGRRAARWAAAPTCRDCARRPRATRRRARRPGRSRRGGRA